MPSSGGYYTYVSRTVGPRAGFLTAWLFFLYTALTPAFSLAMMGWVLESALRAEYGIIFPWWLFLLLGGAFTFWATYRRIEVSAAALMVLGFLEMGIVVLLAGWGLIAPGPGGISLASFNPAQAPSGNGLYLGIIFSLFAMTGWEGVVPLAEESENPRQVVLAGDRVHDPDHGGLPGLHLVGHRDRLGYGRPRGAGRLEGAARRSPWRGDSGGPVGSSSCSHCSTRCSRWPSPAASSPPGCGTRWRGPGRFRMSLAASIPGTKRRSNAVAFQALVTLVGGLGLGLLAGPGPGLLRDGNGLDARPGPHLQRRQPRSVPPLPAARGRVPPAPARALSAGFDRRCALGRVQVDRPPSAPAAGVCPRDRGLWLLAGVTILIVSKSLGRDRWLLAPEAAPEIVD